MALWISCNLHGKPQYYSAKAGASTTRKPRMRSVFDGLLLRRNATRQIAAAYMFHIVQNHPFLDGNKRTGAAAAIVFLAINEIEVEADEDGLVTLTMAVAEGKCGKSEIADFFRSRTH